jgi:hypothetical protein
MSLLLLTRRKGITVPSPDLRRNFSDSINFLNDGLNIELGTPGLLTVSVEDSNEANWDDSIENIWILRENLLALYKLTESVGGQVLHCSINPSNNGQLGSGAGVDTNDPTWSGGVLEFDGVDNYCTLPALINQNSDFTVHIVFRRVDIGAIVRLLFQLDNSGTGRSWLDINSIDIFSSFLGGASTQETNFGALSDDTWYVGTLRKDGGTVSVVRTSEANDGTFVLGIHKTLSSDPFNGSIGLIAFYNAALTDEQIVGNYEALKQYFTEQKSITIS